MALVGAFTETFEDNSLSAEWATPVVANGATVTETNHRLEIMVPQTVGASGYLDWTTGRDLTASAISFLLMRPLRQGNGTRTVYRLYDVADSTDYLQFEWAGGGPIMTCKYALNGVQTTVNSRTLWKASGHAWFQFREAAGTIYWECFADPGDTPVLLGSVAKPAGLTITNMKLRLMAEAISGISFDPGMAVFDSINTQTNAITMEELRLTAQFHTIGAEWFYYGDDHRRATATFRYRVQGAGSWRTGFPMHALRAQDLGAMPGDDHHRSAFYVKGLLLEADTSYDFEFKADSPDGVTCAASITTTLDTAGTFNAATAASRTASSGTSATIQTATGVARTNVDNVTPPSGLVPTKYVRIDGADANTGDADTPGGAWRTPKKALVAAGSGVITKFGGGHFTSAGVPRTLPGTFKGGTLPIAFDSATGRMEYSGSPSTWTVIEPRGADGFPSVCGPTGATDTDLQPGATLTENGVLLTSAHGRKGPWVSTSINDDLGTPRAVWKWTNCPATGASQLHYAATRDTQLWTRVATWDDEDSRSNTPARWAREVYTSAGTGSYHYGAYADSASKDLYMVPPPAVLAGGATPNSWYWVVASLSAEPGQKGLDINADDVRITGLVIRGHRYDIYVNGSVDRMTVDHCVLQTAQSLINWAGNNGTDYGSRPILQYNLMQNSNLWSATPNTGDTVPWWFVKGGYPGILNQASGFNGQDWPMTPVIRFNTCSGGYDFVSGAVDNSNRYAMSNIDIYANRVYRMSDDHCDASDWVLNYALWDHRAEQSLTFMSIVQFTGCAYVFRCSWWRGGHAGMALDESGAVPNGGSVIKHGEELGGEAGRSFGKIFFVHNTVWSDDPPCKGPDDDGGNNTYSNPFFYLRNNLFRVGQRAGDLNNAGRTDYWDEDYNVWVTATASTSLGMRMKVGPAVGMEWTDLSGRTTADYRAYLAANSTAVGKAVNTNKLNGVDVLLKNEAAVDNMMRDRLAGDLRLISGTNYAVGAGMITPVSDTVYPGSGPAKLYHIAEGRTAPCIGYDERDLAVPISSPPPTAPSNLTVAVVSSSRLDPSWTDNSSDESGFEVERAPDVAGSPGTYALISTTAANVTTYQNAGLAGATPFWFRVRAINGNGNSAYTSAVTATTATSGGGVSGARQSDATRLSAVGRSSR